MHPALRIGLQALAVLAILGAGLLVSWRLKNSAPPPPKRPTVTGSREVAAEVLRPGSVRLEIPLQGRLVAFQSVPVIAEVTGVFERSARAFKEGVAYRRGELLVRVNDTEARYGLLAQKSTLAKSLAQAMPELKIDYPETFPAWDAYLRAFDPERPLAPLPAVATDAARFYLNAKDIYTQYYNIKAAEDRLGKYTLTAPFSGVLTDVTATTGGLVRAGQPLATLTATNYELAASVPARDLSYLPVGAQATLNGPDGRNYRGRVARVSTQIDPNTQAATVFLDVSGAGLREGLFLDGSVRGAELTDVVALDQRLLVGTDEVYVVPDSTLERRQIEVVRRIGDRVYVRGLAPGTRVLTESVSGAYEGMRVRVAGTAPGPSGAGAAGRPEVPTDTSAPALAPAAAPAATG